MGNGRSKIYFSTGVMALITFAMDGSRVYDLPTIDCCFLSLFVRLIDADSYHLVPLLGISMPRHVGVRFFSSCLT